MRTTALVLTGLLSALPAQAAIRGITIVRQATARGEWKQALELTLGLLDTASSRLERELLAAELTAIGTGLEATCAFTEALVARERALAVWLRSYDEDDHAVVAASISAVASCYENLGRSEKALPLYEQALAMVCRLHGQRDHVQVAAALNNVAFCLLALGRGVQALSRFEAALAMKRHLHGDRDHDDVALGIDNVGHCLLALGRVAEALPHYEQALEMSRRLHDDGDHVDVARGLNNVGYGLQCLGRVERGLPQVRAALAMRQRLAGDRDDPEVAQSLNNLGGCLLALGQAEQALVQYEAALAMKKRLRGDQDHRDVALALNNVATCLHSLDRFEPALAHLQGALAMRQRLLGGREHADLALAFNNVGSCLESLDRAGQARAAYETSVAMWRNLQAGRDLPDLAQGIHNLAACLDALGDSTQALPPHEEALAMRMRLFGAGDHPHLAQSLANLAWCRGRLGSVESAISSCERACAMIERLREGTRLSPELQQSRFDALKRDGAFEQMQALAMKAGKLDVALLAAERGRGRALLDVWEQRGFDPLDEAERRARSRADQPLLERLRRLRANLETAERNERAGLVQVDSVAAQQQRLAAERAQLVGDVLPVGRVRSAAEIQAALQEGELLLEFTVSKDACVVFVVAGAGDVQALPLPNALSTVQREVPRLLRRVSHDQVLDRRGRDPEAGGSAEPGGDAPARALFDSLIPPELWVRLRAARRVFVAAHRELHRLPFELLVTDVRDGVAKHWLDEGPEIAYVQSGSALHWLRSRGRQAGASGAGAGVVVVGDPRLRDGAHRMRLPPLQGARREAEAIAALVAAQGGRAHLLLEARATERSVFDLAPNAGYLHFACHGIAEECAGQSLSLLALAEPAAVVPEDDGRLELADLLQGWQGRLSSCRLVVLSACRTNVGPLHRDDAPEALPLGFLLAGASSVVSSLWAVDDASTRELMVGFYDRLLRGEGDRLKAFTAARKALRQEHPDPFHWAPFLFLGIPE